MTTRVSEAVSVALVAASVAACQSGKRVTVAGDMDRGPDVGGVHVP